ncbi:MAG TPA: enolase C-terminal domain-like protein [Rectinemataceae bacterium]|nr:enolase C-terminal domain-like protein [Rectinemataceae bacterium]
MQIRLFRRKLALKNPFRIAHGSSAYRESLFIHLREGRSWGMGEAPVVPYYGISADEIEADLRRGLGSPALRGALEWPSSPPIGFAYPVSRAAVQSALLALRAGLGGGALPQLLLPEEAGGEVPPTSFTIAYDDDPEEMLRIASECGFRRLKVKAGIDGDLERIRVLREGLPGAIIRVDANQGWSREEAPFKLRELERLGVELVEEPISGTPADFEALAAGTSLPILLDESARSLDDVRRFAREAPSVAGIVVKTAKNGGPSGSLELLRAARESGMRVMVSSMVESSLGISSALALAPLCSWCDLDAALLIADDPFTGLSYEEEVPRLAPEGIRPGEALVAFIEALDPLIEF